MKYSNHIESMPDATHITPAKALLEPIKYLKKYAREFLFSKIKDYENEQEFRIAIYNTKKQPDFVPIGRAIAGAYCQDSMLEELRMIATKLGVPLAQARWFRGQPDLESLS